MAFKEWHDLVRWIQGSRYKNEKDGPVFALVTNYWSGKSGVWPPEMIAAARAKLSLDLREKRYTGSVGCDTLKSAVRFLDVKSGRRRPDAVGLGPMLVAYVDAAKYYGAPADQDYSDEDFTDAAVKRMKRDVEAFLKANGDDVGTNLSEAGRDLWLTRNREGSGFWDREDVYGKEAAGRLTDAAHQMGESNVELHGGRLHVHP